MITKEAIEEFFHKNYYISNENLTYYTLIAINQMKKGTIRAGQDIYTTCLDGPPGAGKSMYAKLYAKMVHELLGEDVELISYQCDDSTSKIELFEDINVGAAVAGEPEKVNIPGVLARAIIAANKGKKVVLFIDEYDKTREQVDSLFLQMLQDGRINAGQQGDLQIEEKYKGNIQVIFCKNDFRTELTGPLTRRTRIINLDIIKPSDFRNLANRVLYEETIDKQEPMIINLVSFVYEAIYEEKDKYNRVCATSELFGAIQDLTFLARIEAPNHILFETLISDLFKNPDDAEIFKSSIPNLANEALKSTLLAIRTNQNIKNEPKIIDLIANQIKKQAHIEAQAILNEEITRIAEEKARLQQEMMNLIRKQDELDRMKANFAATSEKYFKELESKFSEILAKKESEDTIVGPLKDNKYALNFYDETNLIRRGRNVFETMNNTVLVATLSIPKIEFDNNELMSYLLNANAIVYENGFYITKPYSMILVRKKTEEDNKMTFEIYMDSEFLKEDSKKKEIYCTKSEKERKMGPSYYFIKYEITRLLDIITQINHSDLSERNLNPLKEYYPQIHDYSDSFFDEGYPHVYERVLENQKSF